MNKIKRDNRITLYKKIWCKIRYWQQLNDVSDNQLANDLDVAERTLKEYDKNAGNISLHRLDRFLYVNNLTLSDLFEM